MDSHTLRSLALRIAPANTRILWILQFGCNVCCTFVNIVHLRCVMRHSRRYTDGGPRRRPLLHCGAQSHSLAHDLGIELGIGSARRGRGVGGGLRDDALAAAPPRPTPPATYKPPTLSPFLKCQPHI
ncbi:unnamed protein product [Danaus chrysippus]|uniref:(African queen) hypothetical protein n=1 Tax=Danaus chrysippus TaxID=151541 RepID=A0A8J2W338_9NEOP|nr:unnamed protein product [Danaus chrysippus]